MEKLAPFAFALVLASCHGCGKTSTVSAPRVAEGHTLEAMTVTSSAFAQGGNIPIDNTCDGKDAIPALVLSAAPEGTKSITLEVDDPDAPGGNFTHALVYNLPPDFSRVATGFDFAGTSARFGTNDFGNARYNGPCPPHDELHRYNFTVLALDKAIDLREGLNRTELDAQMDGHVLGRGSLQGTFAH